MEVRQRHMETAGRIDILARTGIILLLPLGLHMGYLWGAQPLGIDWLVLMWVLFAGWLASCWSASYLRDTVIGLRLTKIGEAIRLVIIAVLMLASVSSLLWYSPFGQAKWYSAKVFVYSLTLVIGLNIAYLVSVLDADTNDSILRCD